MGSGSKEAKQLWRLLSGRQWMLQSPLRKAPCMDQPAQRRLHIQDLRTQQSSLRGKKQSSEKVSLGLMQRKRGQQQGKATKLRHPSGSARAHEHGHVL